EAAVLAQDVLHLHLPLRRELGEVPREQGGEGRVLKLLGPHDAPHQDPSDGLQRRRRPRGGAATLPRLGRADGQRQRGPHHGPPRQAVHRTAALREPSSSIWAVSRRAALSFAAATAPSSICSYFFSSSKASATASRAPASSSSRALISASAA